MEEQRERFATLYDTTVDKVMAYCRRAVTVDQAEEAVAETFLAAWRRFDELPDPALPWLLATARNQLRSGWRRTRRRAELFQRLLVLTELAAESAELTALRRAGLLTALAGLSESDREALLLIAWDGLTSDEAATVLGCTPGAFRVRLHRARRRLAAALHDSPAERRDHADTH